MRVSLKFLCAMVCAAFVAPAVANVATTAGSNLTAYNGTGATNNNQWNNLMNGRGGMSATTADANFGNCNAVILRCASPKCSGGGCYDMNVARPIVAGCVNSNNACKKHGDALIDYITAQVVAQSNAKQQEQANAVAIAQAQAEAQAAASAAATAQSNAQMQAMQAQMQQMQEQMAESMNAMQAQMAAQSETQNAQIQNALAEQRESMAASTSMANSTGDTGAVIAGLEGLGVAEQLAAKNGISADILVREQMGGKIETAIEDAMTAMKDLKEKLDAVLEYAGCDSSATNCTGPKRVKKFKDLANEFFDPYENVVENVYDALILAMTLGIDVNDVIMLLSESCNIWGKYICGACAPTDPGCVCNDTKNKEGCYYRVETDPKTGNVSKNQPHCRLVDTLTEKDTVWREWIDANTGMTGSTQVACASDVIMNAPLFRNMKKNATMDIDNLRRLVAQDSRACSGKMENGKFILNGKVEEACRLNRCAVPQGTGSEQYDLLVRTVDSRRLPTKTSSNGSATDVLCYTNEDRLPDVDGVEIEVAMNGLKTNISSCDIYTTEALCEIQSNCLWLSLSKKCVSREANTEPTEAALDKYGKTFCLQHYSQDWCDDYYKYADDNLKTEPTELWQNSYLQSVKTPSSSSLTENKVNTTLTTKKTFGNTLINTSAATKNF